jgi:hypothetical protein
VVIEDGMKDGASRFELVGAEGPLDDVAAKEADIGEGAGDLASAYAEAGGLWLQPLPAKARGWAWGLR